MTQATGCYRFTRIVHTKLLSSLAEGSGGQSVPNVTRNILKGSIYVEKNDTGTAAMLVRDGISR